MWVTFTIFVSHDFPCPSHYAQSGKICSTSTINAKAWRRCCRYSSREQRCYCTSTHHTCIEAGEVSQPSFASWTAAGIVPSSMQLWRSEEGIDEREKYYTSRGIGESRSDRPLRHLAGVQVFNMIFFVCHEEFPARLFAFCFCLVQIKREILNKLTISPSYFKSASPLFVIGALVYDSSQSSVILLSWS